MFKANNLPPFCAVVTKSGNLNFLKPSGPLQACNGTALPSTLPLLLYLYLVICSVLDGSFSAMFYYSLNILVFLLPDDGKWPSKHVAMITKLYRYV